MVKPNNKEGRDNMDNYYTPFFIAGIGTNHNGDIGIVKQSIDMVNRRGCDVVKF